MFNKHSGLKKALAAVMSVLTVVSVSTMVLAVDDSEPEEYGYTHRVHWDDYVEEVKSNLLPLGEEIPFEVHDATERKGITYLLDKYTASTEISNQPTKNNVEIFYTKDLNGNGIPDKYEDSDDYSPEAVYAYKIIEHFDELNTIDGIARLGTKIPYNDTYERVYKGHSYKLVNIDMGSARVSSNEDENVVNLYFEKRDSLGLVCTHGNIYYVAIPESEEHKKMCGICEDLIAMESHIDANEDKLCDACGMKFIADDPDDSGNHGGDPIVTPTPEPTPDPTPTPEPEKVYHKAYISGRGNNKVAPNANITRAEVCQIFYGLMDEETQNYWKAQIDPYAKPFKDVPVDQWYSTAVMVCQRAGLVTGYPDKSFKPSQNITRAEFAVIVAKQLEEDGSYKIKFKDIEKNWARKYIELAASNGLVMGYGDDTFRPNNRITRAEAITITNRLLGRRATTDGIHADIKKFDDVDEKAWYYMEIVEATNPHWVLKDATREEWVDPPKNPTGEKNPDIINGDQLEVATDEKEYTPPVFY